MITFVDSLDSSLDVSPSLSSSVDDTSVSVKSGIGEVEAGFADFR